MTRRYLCQCNNSSGCEWHIASRSEVGEVEGERDVTQPAMAGMWVVVVVGVITSIINTT